jgi:RNA polymerase sigma factor (sigma-70 family)
LDLSVADPEVKETELDLLILNEALDRLATDDARAAELVKLKFFAGMTTQQAAEVLGISASTAYVDWAYAKAWLRVEMSEPPNA